MKLLLDTHILIWWFAGDRKLIKRVKARIDDPGNDVFVSAATAWELATKYRLGKMPEAEFLVSNFFAQLDAWHFEKLPLTVEHGHRAGLLPGDHRDPFDRMLAAQAIIEDLVLVTADPELAGLGARVVW